MPKKRSLESPREFVNNNIPIVYNTDNINPIYIDSSTGEVWQTGKSKGAVVLPEVTVKGTILKTKEAMDKLPKEKGLENPTIDPFLAAVGFGRGVSNMANMLFPTTPVEDIVGLPLGIAINKGVKKFVSRPSLEGLLIAKDNNHGLDDLKNITSQLDITSPFYKWETAINRQNDLYDKAAKGVEEGQRLYDNLINSPEYFDRIKKAIRLHNLRGDYKSARTLRKEFGKLPYDWQEPWSPYKNMSEVEAEQIVKRKAKEHVDNLIEKGRLRDLSDDAAKEELNSIKKANKIRGEVYQDVIQTLDENNEFVTKPMAVGGYDRHTKMVHIKPEQDNVPISYIHEHGGHRTHANAYLGYSNALGYDNNGASNIRTFFDFDEPFAKYYRNFDEARARTIPILAVLKDKGYNLSYGGFKKWLKDNNMRATNTDLHPYDEATIKHLINTVYGGAGIIGLSTLSSRQEKKDGGSIHIAPSKRGTFTAAASKHGMGVQEFASRVLRNKENYSPAMIKKANFARNASKWNH